MNKVLQDFFVEYNKSHIPIRILSVDDDHVVQFKMQHSFNVCGFVTDIAFDGSQAVELIKNNIVKYDFILMDIHMPEMNGIDAVKIIRRMRGYENTPIFALTGDLSIDLKLQVVSSGMNEYFSKPVEVDNVLDSIMHYIKNKY